MKTDDSAAPAPAPQLDQDRESLLAEFR